MIWVAIIVGVLFYAGVIVFCLALAKSAKIGDEHLDRTHRLR